VLSKKAAYRMTRGLFGKSRPETIDNKKSPQNAGFSRATNTTIGLFAEGEINIRLLS
jgi:hypothetical protein